MRRIFALLIFSISSGLFAQTKEICVTAEEQKLYDLIMEYRAEYGLPKIPMSKSLSYVAHQHAWDLQVNAPVKGNCNMHSWSNKGPWTECCYTSDHKNAKGMWDKPKELTSYKGTGFEISCGGSNNLTADESLESWKGSEGHNNVIINKDIWEKYTWNAIGISIKGNYAVVWFGRDPDAEGEPEICK